MFQIIFTFACFYNLFLGLKYEFNLKMKELTIYIDN